MVFLQRYQFLQLTLSLDFSTLQKLFFYDFSDNFIASLSFAVTL